MRFNSIGGSDAGKYAAAGKSVADSAAAMFKKQRETGPDYAGLSKVAMQTASDERVAATQAEAAVTNAGIKAYSDTANNAIKAEAGLRVNKLKIKTKMAGGLAAIGMAAGASRGSSSRDRPPRPVPPMLQATPAKPDYSSIRTRNQQMRDRWRDQDNNSSSSSPSGGSPSPRSSNPSTSSQALGGPDANSSWNTDSIQQLYIDQGMDPQSARTMAAINMAESGGRPGIDTVQSGLDPDQRYEFSVGLSQINVQAHGDKLRRRGWTADDLRDPVKNAQIAMEVWEEAGRRFTPWSAYTNGSYTSFMKRQMK